MSGGRTASPDWHGRPTSLWVLLGLHALLGVRGLAGGAQFLAAPSGALVGLSTAMLDGTPFRDFFLPGLFLFVVLGAGPLAVLAGLARDSGWAWYGSLAVAATLAVWVLVEGVLIGFGRRLQYPNLLQAVVMALLTLSPAVRRHYQSALPWRPDAGHNE
jgi:hypothetical protein